MTALARLQQHLAATGRYFGAVDGDYGPLTRAAILTALTDGPDTPLDEHDYRNAADALAVPCANIRAVADVEASGAGFFGGKPLILPEPHRFSKLTEHRFDRTYPGLSYPRWGTRPYPRTQAGRYEQLLAMVALDVEAGFSACSYGKFQILGENHADCGFATAWAFAFAQARDERTQLTAFVNFLRATGLAAPLRASMWAVFARGYNSPAFAKNRYDTRLAQAAERRARAA